MGFSVSTEKHPYHMGSCWIALAYRELVSSSWMRFFLNDRGKWDQREQGVRKIFVCLICIAQEKSKESDQLRVYISFRWISLPNKIERDWSAKQDCLWIAVSDNFDLQFYLTPPFKSRSRLGWYLQATSFGSLARTFIVRESPYRDYMIFLSTLPRTL